MISVQEAYGIVLSHLFTPTTTKVAIEQSVSRVLAEDIHADRDLPPFDRVTMDGIAISFSQFQKGQRSFRIEGMQAAGEPKKVLADPAACFEVMTGAILPEGTDTVIRYEDISIDSSIATVNVNDVERRQSIHSQGQDARRNETMLSSGMVLSPAEVALLASVGQSNVPVKIFPRTAVISSGDELVAITDQPLPHQIRRSNSYAIHAAMQTFGWPSDQYHMPDNEDVLRKELSRILDTNDTLILSGGVSKGKFDYIPKVMNDLGVRTVFHQVSQRPGKPFWFGVTDNRKTVFALPGNPVSTFMCFYRYIIPWMKKSMGLVYEEQFAILAKDFSFTPRLTYFLQVGVKNEKGRIMAYPDAGGGSGDFANLRKIDGFLELPLERTTFEAGESFPYFSFRPSN